MPWFRNIPAGDDGTPTPQTPQPWWPGPSAAPGVPPEPGFDAIVGGQATAAGELPAASPAAGDQTAPERTAPERRRVLGGLPRAFAPVTPAEGVDPFTQVDGAGNVTQVDGAEALAPASPADDLEVSARVASVELPPAIPPSAVAQADIPDVEPVQEETTDDVAAEDSPAFAYGQPGEPAGQPGGADEAGPGAETGPADPEDDTQQADTTFHAELAWQAAAQQPSWGPAAEEFDVDGDVPAPVVGDGTRTPPDDVVTPGHTDPEDPAYDDEPIHPWQPEQEIPVPVAEIGVGFGERIERLIAAAVTEAENTRADAQHEAAQLVQSAQLDAEHALAAAQRQSAEIVAATQRRCDDELAAAQRTREEAEQVLAEAREEAEQLRRRVRDEVAELRAEVDLHAQAMLARTHADTNRTLASARAELEEIALRKAELEEQMASIRALLSEAVVEPLPQDAEFLAQPPGASTSPDPQRPDA